MDNISIEDFVPQDAEIVIGGKTYHMRKINVEDEVWLRTTFGKGISDIFMNMHFDQIARLIFRQLKDKSDFMPTEEDGLDDDGYPVKVKVTGPMRILKSMTGMQEKNDAVYAVVQLIGVSRPMMDKMVEAELEEKKKVIEQMVQRNQELAGQKSSTESQASTDIQ